MQEVKDVWKRTQRIHDFRQKLQDDLNIVVNEDTLNSTLRETEEQLQLLFERQ